MVSRMIEGSTIFYALEEKEDAGLPLFKTLQNLQKWQAIFGTVFYLGMAYFIGLTEKEQNG